MPGGAVGDPRRLGLPGGARDHGPARSGFDHDQLGRREDPPEEVETACRSFAGVADVIVTGVPDPRWGARVVALVEPAAGATIDLAELQDHCRTQIAGYKVPREVVIGPVQRTNIGKPDYAWAKARACEVLGIDR
ncbi:MAG: hypothetical protein R2695_13720 [Acidimicrobiales bacterium]